MTGQDALEALLARLAASYEGSVFFGETDLEAWPKSAVSVLKRTGLLTTAEPARSATCDGCERQCAMPVEIVNYPAGPAAFVMCDKRGDTNRVDVPLERLRRWQASGEAVAAYLAASLGISRPSGTTFQRGRWEVGILRGKHSGQLTLANVSKLTLEIAGHAVPLVEVLLLTGGRLEVQRQRLTDCVDHPAAGGGTRESGADRRERTVARCAELKAQGYRNFRVIVAREQSCSVETIKKLLAKGKSSARSMVRHQT